MRSAVTTELRGLTLLACAALNKGTAFEEKERAALGLEGLIPPKIEVIEDQLERIRAGYDSLHEDLERHVFLRALQDDNEVLFYRFLVENLAELMPIVYTPTVGEACRSFSRIYRRPHGLFLNFERRRNLHRDLASVPHQVDVIVVTDGERILGLGDQGLGGMGIPIGKLSLYTAVGGIDPNRTLPVLLDVGTDNPQLLDDPLYLGARHQRIDGSDYYDFVGEFVAAVSDRWPRALLQWEDFAGRHAGPLLQAHKGSVLSFNDDIQGTAVVALSTIRVALARAGTALPSCRVVIAGAGAAGTGIAAMLAGAGVPASQIFLADSGGLVHDRRRLSGERAEWAQRWESVAGWARASGPTSLDEVVAQVAPDVLVGVTGQQGLFGEAMIRHLAADVDRPIVLPMSNPTSKSEATPHDLLRWTAGRALVATGSPFSEVTLRGRTRAIAQANNVYVFPGLGLGSVAAGAVSVTDGMLTAASAAIAAAGREGGENGGRALLPPIDRAGEVALRVAKAVARAARDEGVADQVPDEELDRRIEARCWRPEYPAIEPG